MILDGYYRNKNQKESRAFFKNGTPTLPDKHSAFLKCPETIGGKNTLGKVRWPSDWYY
jgi:hypothetical protein